LLPLHEEAACAIRHLQQLHHGQRGLPDGRTGVTTRYLFMHRGTRFSARYLLDDALQKVCEQVGLLTPEGKPMIWPIGLGTHWRGSERVVERDFRPSRNCSGMRVQNCRLSPLV
jgi:hypothetical protein